MSKIHNENIPSPMEAFRRFQRELELQLGEAERDIVALRNDTQKNLTTLQNRCAKIREMLELLGNHATNHPNDPLPKDVWEKMTSI